MTKPLSKKTGRKSARVKSTARDMNESAKKIAAASKVPAGRFNGHDGGPVVAFLKAAMTGPPTAPCWWITCNSTGVSRAVPGVPPDRWYDARFKGLAILAQEFGRSFCQDGVRLDWVEAR